MVWVVKSLLIFFILLKYTIYFINFSITFLTIFVPMGPPMNPPKIMLKKVLCTRNNKKSIISTFDDLKGK